MNDFVSRRTIGPAEFSGQRLDRAAAEIWSDYSRSRIRQWIASGELTVDGAVVLPRRKLKGGETIAVDASFEPVLEMKPEPILLSILHEDADHRVAFRGQYRHFSIGPASCTTSKCWSETFIS